MKSNNQSPDVHRLESNIRYELDSLYLQEGILWRSKFRDTWLTCKDLHTKYFHLSTLIKHRQNAIDFLKLNTGAWISDRRFLIVDLLVIASTIILLINSPLLGHLHPLNTSIYLIF
jgi:hypothetical protein